jgi:hypothetical protein
LCAANIGRSRPSNGIAHIPERMLQKRVKCGDFAWLIGITGLVQVSLGAQEFHKGAALVTTPPTSLGQSFKGAKPPPFDYSPCSALIAPYTVITSNVMFLSGEHWRLFFDRKVGSAKAQAVRLTWLPNLCLQDFVVGYNPNI